MWFSSTATPRELSSVILSQVRSHHMPRMRFAWQREDTATSFSSPLTPWAAMSPRHSKPTSVAHIWPTPVTPRFTPPAFPLAETTSPSSRSCQSRSVTMVASGCRSPRRTLRPFATALKNQRTLPRRTAIIIWSANTRPSETLLRATSHPVQPRKYVTRAEVSHPRDLASISTSRTPLPAWARMSSGLVMETSSRCMRKSLATTPTKRQCRFSPLCTTPWGACGWTTIYKPPSPACTASARRISQSTEPTAWAPLRSCKAWLTAIL